jgi:hypothetical protein
MVNPTQPRNLQGNFSEIITTGERVRTKFLSRQMNSPSSQIVHNKLASPLLCRLLDWRKWNELKLAEVSGILPSVISAHLSGQRPIRPQHLAAYLRALDRQERGALLDAWLQDNVNREAIANLLDGTKTDSMRSTGENRRRMLDWWAMAIARDSRLAKIFHRFRGKAAQLPLELLSLVSTTAVQFQGWVVEKACGLFTRVKHATVALVTLVLALCQSGKVTQQAGELAEHGGELAGKAIANSLLATSFLTPALAETTNLNFNLRDSSPAADKRQDGVASRASVKGVPRLLQRPYRGAPALRIQRAIGHEWNRLVRAPKSVHSAFTRLIRDAHPRQFKQTHRKPRRS